MDIKEMKRFLYSENLKYGKDFVEIPPEQWPKGNFDLRPVKIFRNRDFVAYLYKLDDPEISRLTVHRSSVVSSPNPPGFCWNDGISWDELQTIKNQCGFEGLDAVEVFPREIDEVNVANMRHLWIFSKPLSFAWRTYVPPKVIIPGREGASIEDIQKIQEKIKRGEG